MEVVNNNCALSWGNHKENIVSVIQGLYVEEKSFDCTLSAEGQKFDVHKVVVSSCSPFLETILKDHSHDNPVITLDGVSALELRTIVEYMYTGETSIAPEDITSFFQTTKLLQICGLKDYTTVDLDNAIVDEEVCKTELETVMMDYLEQDMTVDDKNTDEELQQCLKMVNQAQDRHRPTNYVQQFYMKPHFISANDCLEDDEEDEMIEALDDEEDEDGDVLEEEEEQLIDTNDRIEENEEEKEEEDVGGDAVKKLEVNAEVKTVEETEDMGDIERIEEENTIEDRLEDEEEGVNEEEEAVMGEDRIVEDYASLHRRGRQWRSLMNTSTRLLCKTTRKSTYVLKRPSSIPVIGRQLDDKFTCLKCGNKYAHKRTLLHHIHWICQQPATYSCNMCPYMGKRKFQLKSHMKHVHMVNM